MASSGKTNTLKLSLWEAGDRPERLDFRQDNEKLEAQVGSHLTDALLHLTPEQKEYLRRPCWIINYSGSSGKWQTYYSLDPIPQFVLVLCESKPPMEIGADGKVTMYMDYWSRGSSTEKPYYGGGSVLVSPEKKYISFGAKDTDTVNRRVNELDLCYTAICFGTVS